MLLPFWGLWQAYHEANPNSCISQRNILLSYQRSPYMVGGRYGIYHLKALFIVYILYHIYSR